MPPAKYLMWMLTHFLQELKSAKRVTLRVLLMCIGCARISMNAVRIKLGEAVCFCLFK